MNPDQPSREQVEARITALLLGELPAEEAALLRYTIAQDPALQKLHDELQAALVLVREAARNPEEPNTGNQAPLRLSAERRQKLLAHFQTPRPPAASQPLFWLKPIKLSPLIPALVSIAIIAVLAAMLLPVLSSAKRKAQSVTSLSAGVPRDLQYRTWGAEKESPQPPPPTPMGAAPAAYLSRDKIAPANGPEVVTLTPQPKLASPPASVPPVQIVLPQIEPGPVVIDQSGAKQISPLGLRGAGNVPPGTPEAIPPAEPLRLRDDEASLAAAKQAGESTAVTLGPEPNLAPPPNTVSSAQSILPPAQLAGQLNARAAATSQIYSQNIVGYVNIATNARPLQALRLKSEEVSEAIGPTGRQLNINQDTQERRERVEKEWKQPQAADNLALAKPAQKQWIVPGEETRTPNVDVNEKANKSHLGTISGQGGTFAFGGGVGGFGGTGGGGGAAAQRENEAAKLKSSGNYDGFFAPQAANESAAPNQSSGNRTFAENAPDKPGHGFSVLGPISGVDRVEPGAPAAIPAAPLPALAAPMPAAGLSQGVPAGASPEIATGPTPATSTRAVHATVNGFYPESKPELPKQETPLLGDVPSMGALFQTQATTFAQTPTTRAATPPAGAATPVAAGGTLYFDDQAGKRPYDEAKRELEQKREQHRMLYAKLEAERVDLNLPQNSMVQITDPAQPNSQQTFWQHLTGQYESQARVKVANDVTDIVGLASNPQSAAYDPYFIQTTREIVQSDRVLSNVVERLNLQSAWARKDGGQKLTLSEAVARVKNQLDLRPVPNTKLIEIRATSDDPKEAADLANAVALAYRDDRLASRRALAANGITVLEEQFQQQEHDIKTNAAYLEQLGQAAHSSDQSPAARPASGQTDQPLRKPAPNTPVPQPEILTLTNAFSTFALNVSDVSFKFAEASLQNNKLPDTASIRSEEFINAFDYRDPEAAAGQPMAFTAERARYPFAHNRELLRLALKAAAAGRQPGRALNLVLLLDVSGSMERADRVAIIHEALRVLAAQLQPPDTVSVVTFSRTAHLWADGVHGNQAGATLERVGGITPEGGTNLEEAMRLAYETAHRHYLANGMNRVVLLTDGAANLGDVDPGALQQKVEAQRRQGIALDCFGIGWEDYNDDLLERLSSHGDGRYAFLNSPEDAARDFAAKLAGALQIAAADLKVQVEFNPARVTAYRQIGYATHQLTKEQFRDNTVAAGEIAAQEAGNALYAIETNPAGEGSIATVRVRYRIPGTTDYREQSWDVPYTGNAPALERSSPALRLAATAGAFSEWLAASPYAQEVTPDALLNLLSGVPEVYGADDRPKQLETMIREARSLAGQ